MSKQNRVTPYNQLIANPARGTLMGNRGCLHNPQQHIVRHYQVKRWIICLLAFKTRHRRIMQPNQYTELFFLDEATALSAGHRPCAECQSTRYHEFRQLWAIGNAWATPPSAEDIDTYLHAERIDKKGKKVVYEAPFDALPNGTFIALSAPTANTPAYVIDGQYLLRWTPSGYTERLLRPTTNAFVLTPRSTVRTLTNGYQTQLHRSAFA